MKELKQTKNFVTREFRISDSRLFYKISKFGNEDEIDIPFENINGDIASHKSSKQIFKILALVIYFISLIIQISIFSGGKAQNFSGLLIAIVATLFLILYSKTKQEFWKLKLVDENYLFFHKNIPSKSACDIFLEKLMKSRNDYLKENYAVVDENLDYETQLNSFKWLKSIHAITKDEFNRLYSELKKSIKSDKPSIGFERKDIL